MAIDIEPKSRIVEFRDRDYFKNLPQNLRGEVKKEIDRSRGFNPDFPSYEIPKNNLYLGRVMFVEDAHIPRGFLIRRLDEEGEEAGPYLAVRSRQVGPANNENGIKWVNVLEVDTKGDEPVMTETYDRVEPGEVIKIVGLFYADEHEEELHRVRGEY